MKMARLMTSDDYTALREGFEYEKLMITRFDELHLYKMVGFTKLSAIEALNSLQKYKRQNVSRFFNIKKNIEMKLQMI